MRKGRSEGEIDHCHSGLHVSWVDIDVRNVCNVTNCQPHYATPSRPYVLYVMYGPYCIPAMQPHNVLYVVHVAFPLLCPVL